jgi:hypothetical protein
MNAVINFYAVGVANADEEHTELFTVYCALHNLEKRRDELCKDIEGEGWKSWNPGKRKDAVARAKSNAWDIGVMHFVI